MKSGNSHQLARTLPSSEGSSSSPEDAEAISLDVATSPRPSASDSDGDWESGSADPDIQRRPIDAARCLTDEEIVDYQAGQSTLQQRDYIDAHLDACSGCRELVYAVLGGPDEVVGRAASDSRARVTTFTRGQVVSGRYRITRFVAKSGMGEVYEAFDTLREKRLALKTMLCTTSDDPRAARALTLEVEHALLVSHPNVCRVYELGEHRNLGCNEPPVRYLTMEFVDGETLGHRIHGATLTLAEVRRIALQLLSGLAAAHAKSVLHLDFKSDNVMLRNGADPPDALIMDFGLSRTRSLTSTLHPSEQELRGTPGYMAPEQLECTATSRATDVYAFGIVFFEMLVGSLPFTAGSLSALLLKQLRTRAPAPSQHRAGLSPELDRFVARCLERKPEQRYADAARALAALEGIRAWQAPSSSASRRRGAIWGTCCAAVLAAGGLAHVGRSSVPEAPRPSPTALEQVPNDSVFPMPERAPAPPAAPPGGGSPAREAQGTGAPKPLAPGVPLTPEPRRARETREKRVSRPVVLRVDDPPAPPVSGDSSAAPGWRHIPKGGFWLPEPHDGSAAPPPKARTQKRP